jgi:hypothetical protein
MRAGYAQLKSRAPPKLRGSIDERWQALRFVYRLTDRP